jgi:hypothetical protein
MADDWAIAPPVKATAMVISNLAMIAVCMINLFISFPFSFVREGPVKPGPSLAAIYELLFIAK